MKSSCSSLRLCRGAGTAMVMALVAMSGTARGEIIEVAWDAAGRFERVSAVAPGKFTEVCDKLPAGAKVRWDFEASAPLDFNVHYHVGKEVVFPSKLSAVSTATGTLDAKIEQDYCWLWSNKSTAAATIKVRLQR